MKRARRFWVPNFSLDSSSREPLQRRLYAGIAQAIRSGEVGNGARLPSSRMMAKMLGVSRNTVMAAYDALAADDLIQGGQGAGTTVKAGVSAGLRFIPLRHVIREARYPSRTISVADPDGNPIYLNF